MQSDLVDAYLDCVADDIETEEALAHQRRIVCAVIQRLIVKEHNIIVLNDDEVFMCVFEYVCENYVPRNPAGKQIHDGRA